MKIKGHFHTLLTVILIGAIVMFSISSVYAQADDFSETQGSDASQMHDNDPSDTQDYDTSAMQDSDRPKVQDDDVSGEQGYEHTQYAVSSQEITPFVIITPATPLVSIMEGGITTGAIVHNQSQLRDVITSTSTYRDVKNIYLGFDIQMGEGIGSGIEIPVNIKNNLTFFGQVPAAYRNNGYTYADGDEGCYQLSQTDTSLIMGYGIMYVPNNTAITYPEKIDFTFKNIKLHVTKYTYEYNTHGGIVGIVMNPVAANKALITVTFENVTTTGNGPISNSHGKVIFKGENHIDLYNPKIGLSSEYIMEAVIADDIIVEKNNTGRPTLSVLCRADTNWGVFKLGYYANLAPIIAGYMPTYTFTVEEGAFAEIINEGKYGIFTPHDSKDFNVMVKKDAKLNIFMNEERNASLGTKSALFGRTFLKSGGNITVEKGAEFIIDKKYCCFGSADSAIIDLAGNLLVDGTMEIRLGSSLAPVSLPGLAPGPAFSFIRMDTPNSTIKIGEGARFVLDKEIDKTTVTAGDARGSLIRCEGKTSIEINNPESLYFYNGSYNPMFATGADPISAIQNLNISIKTKSFYFGNDYVINRPLQKWNYTDELNYGNSFVTLDVTNASGGGLLYGTFKSSHIGIADNYANSNKGLPLNFRLGPYSYTTGSTAIDYFNIVRFISLVGGKTDVIIGNETEVEPLNDWNSKDIVGTAAPYADITVSFRDNKTAYNHSTGDQIEMKLTGEADENGNFSISVKDSATGVNGKGYINAGVIVTVTAVSSRYGRTDSAQTTVLNKSPPEASPNDQIVEIGNTSIKTQNAREFLVDIQDRSGGNPVAEIENQHLIDTSTAGVIEIIVKLTDSKDAGNVSEIPVKIYIGGKKVKVTFKGYIRGSDPAGDEGKLFEYIEMHEYGEQIDHYPIPYDTTVHPLIFGRVCAGYSQQDNGGNIISNDSTQMLTAVSLTMPGEGIKTVVFYYVDSSLSVSIPTQMIFGAFQSEDNIMSPEYKIINHSQLDVNVILSQFETFDMGGIQLVPASHTTSGGFLNLNMKVTHRGVGGPSEQKNITLDQLSPDINQRKWMIIGKEFGRNTDQEAIRTAQLQLNGKYFGNYHFPNQWIGFKSTLTFELDVHNIRPEMP